jgi:phenylacetate-CoA ligase
MIKKLISKSPYLLKKLMKLKSMAPNQIACYAKKNCNIYKELYVYSDTKSFKSLPLLTKKQISLASPFDMLSKKEKNKAAIYAETTGSSGNPTPSFYNEKEFMASLLLSRITPYYKLLKKVRNQNRVAVNGITHGFTIAGHSFGNILQKNGFLTAHLGTRSTIATPKRIARAIVRLKPSIIAASPIDFISWMRIIKEDYSPGVYKDIVEHLKVLLSTAELCSKSRSQQIMNHFNITHINTYACVEGFFSMPCPCKEMHVLPIYEAEIFDDNLKYTGTTGTGRLAFTNLIRKSTPFVRYLLDDYVTISKSDCPFGYETSITPHGRYEMTCVINNKRYATGHFEELIFRRGFAGDYRVNIYNQRIVVDIEVYENIFDAKGLSKDFSKEFGYYTSTNTLTFGKLTKYKEVRMSKPVLKLNDLRDCSTQKLPEYV